MRKSRPRRNRASKNHSWLLCEQPERAKPWQGLCRDWPSWALSAKPSGDRKVWGCPGPTFPPLPWCLPRWLLTEDVQHRVFPKHDEVPHHHVAHQLLQLGSRTKGVSGMLRLTGALLHGNNRAWRASQGVITPPASSQREQGSSRAPDPCVLQVAPKSGLV